MVENTPKYLRRSKVPVVKAKVGPKIMTFMCDASIFPQVPIKKEVKATVSGIYITSVRGIRGPLEAPEKKKGFMALLKMKKPENNTKDIHTWFSDVDVLYFSDASILSSLLTPIFLLLPPGKAL